MLGGLFFFILALFCGVFAGWKIAQMIELLWNFDFSKADKTFWFALVVLKLLVLALLVASFVGFGTAFAFWRLY